VRRQSCCAPLLGPDGFVVPLQNGVEAPAQIAAVLGAEPYIGFGELASGLSPRAERLQAAFGRARGVTAEALAGSDLDRTGRVVAGPP
jgi:2-dehydropantoate 2-reductase